MKLTLVPALIGFAALTLPAAAADVTFMLTNASSYTVTGFYTSPAGTEGWANDMFGESYLPAGNQVKVSVDRTRGSCLYHMRFVLEDESEMVESGMNLCELSEYTLSNAP